MDTANRKGRQLNRQTGGISEANDKAFALTLTVISRRHHHLGRLDLVIELSPPRHWSN
jgi:hypothetical protein